MNPVFSQQLAQTDSGGGFPFIIGVFFGLVCYFIGTFPIYKIAEKLGEENAWLAFIPIANLFLLASMAGKEWYWVLLFLIPIVGFFVAIYLFMCISDNLGYPQWMGLISIIPPIFIFVLYYWAFAPSPSRMS